MKKQWIVGISPILLLSSMAYAKYDEPQQDDFMRHLYMGVGFAFVDTDENVDGLGKIEWNSTLLGLHLGYQLHQNFALEVRGYGNIDDDEISGVSVGVDSHFSVLAKGILPIDQYFKPYVILGYGKTKMSVGNVSDRDSDFIYGVGVTVNNGNPLELEVEWIKMYDERFSDANYNYHVTSNSINLNLIYHFPSPDAG